LIISPVNTQYKHNYTYLTQILDMYIIRYVAIYIHTHTHFWIMLQMQNKMQL